jgi:triphosphoribosyl-dephospho-CoA synthase
MATWLDREQVASAAQLACLLEASAPKPGNVSPGRDYGDASYQEFLASASAIGPALVAAGAEPLGVTIRRAVEATSVWVRSNTNLGMVLLLAPLAGAASVARESGAVPAPAPLRAGLRRLLAGTTIDDAREVYAAIRTAAPGGLGRVASQDVSGEPTVTLLDAMHMASARDTVAGEYASAFAFTFDHGYRWLHAARVEGLSWDDAIVDVFLRLLVASPDTHIARRAGQDAADEVSRLASGAIDAGGVRTAVGRRTIDDMDRALRSGDNRLNPGATADVTTAAVFVELLTGGWPVARRP